MRHENNGERDQNRAQRGIRKEIRNGTNDEIGAKHRKQKSQAEWHGPVDDQYCLVFWQSAYLELIVSFVLLLAHGFQLRLALGCLLPADRDKRKTASQACLI